MAIDIPPLTGLALKIEWLDHTINLTESTPTIGLTADPGWDKPQPLHSEP